MLINDYTENTEFTELTNDLLDIRKISDDIAGICKFVQGNLIHSYWLEHYGVEAEPLNKLTEMQTRYAKDLVTLAMSKSDEPSHVSRNQTIE